MRKHATAVWEGDLKDGKGLISTESGALEIAPYGFQSRFAGRQGLNPEELVGAAHAGCFNMALSNALDEAGFTAERLTTDAEITLDQIEGGFAVTRSALTLTARIPGIDDATFQEIAADAKANCPISKLMNTEITLQASLT